MRFQMKLSLLIVVFFLSSSLFAEEKGDGRLSFYAYYLKETVEIQYRQGDHYLPEGLKKVTHLFRSRDSGKVHEMDPRLLELLDQIEDHFGVRQVEIISGYRSPEFNNYLKETGHFVAKESYHTKGMAADIHLDEITEEAVRDYALSLKAGGVGIYPANNMVHVDVGRVQTWEQKGKRKERVGEKNLQAVIQFVVDPTRSLDKKLHQVLIESDGEERIQSKLVVEFFEGNSWKEVGLIELPELKDCTSPIKGKKKINLKSFSFDHLPYGKFRLRAMLCHYVPIYQYSNEFYLKRM